MIPVINKLQVIGLPIINVFQRKTLVQCQNTLLKKVNREFPHFKNVGNLTKHGK